MKNLSDFTRKVLTAMNPDPELARQVLNPQGLYPISQSESMKRFVDRMEKARENQEKILVAGDYDCDGIMSSTIFVEGLKAYGLTVGYYIPDRIKEGYGLKPKTVEMAAEKGYNLIVTCDNGVKADPALERAKELGVEVIVTDHHLLPENVECEVLVHPDTLEAAFSTLCGAGVAYECIRALGIEQDRFLIWAAMASIADCMEVRGETRAIIQEGLKLFNQKGEPHLEPFVRSKPITERDAAFQIAPRVNSIGRLADRANVNTFVRYLEAVNPRVISQYADKVIALNDNRKQLCNMVYAQSQALIHPTWNVLLAMSPNFHEGVIGLAAGNLCSQYGKPAIVCTKGESGYKGSMRGPKGFHCLNFLSEFDGYSALGGHAQAAGFTVQEDRWEDFETFVKTYSRKFEWEPVEEVTISIEPEEITIENIRSLDAFRPFGQGFELPRFRLDQPEIVSQFDLSGGTHRKFTLANGVQAIHFNQSSTDAASDPSTIESLIGTLSISCYRGRESADFVIDEIVYRI